MNLICATKPWSRIVFDAFTEMCRITQRQELSATLLEKLQPNYVFFPHWSWKVPKNIYDNYNCVCFHETDLPFGRGGSPIQNLISRGYDISFVTALKMVDEMDAGPIYAKDILHLHGSAEEIFIRVQEIIVGQINYILQFNPEPIPQAGEPIVFKRRTPDQSTIEGLNYDQLYNHMRMLDAETYPKAFLKLQNYKITFSNVSQRHNKLEARVEIERVGNSGSS